MRAVRDLRASTPSATRLLLDGRLHPELLLGALVRCSRSHGSEMGIADAEAGGLSDSDRLDASDDPGCRGTLLGWCLGESQEGELCEDGFAAVRFASETVETQQVLIDSLSFFPNLLRSAEVGLRVRRGPDWDWGDQDGPGNLGLTVAAESPDWVSVCWDGGGQNTYRVGADGRYDLLAVERSPRLPDALWVMGAGGTMRDKVNGRYLLDGYLNGKPKYKMQNGEAIIYFQTTWRINYCDAVGWVYEHSALAPSPPSGLWSVADGESVECHPAPTVSQDMGSVLSAPLIGVRVRRGPDWEWEDQDGGLLGTTLAVEARFGWVAVRWDQGTENKYRVGADGKFDLVVVGVLRVSGAGGVGDPVNGSYLPCGSHQGKVKYKKRNGEAIIYFQGKWKINDEDDTGGWYYSHPDASVSVPLGLWTTEGYAAQDAEPAPTVEFREDEDPLDWLQETQAPVLEVPLLRAPLFGVRVTRGPGWRWNDQDGGCLGTTVERLSATPGWVGVRWDNACENNYRVGADGSYDLLVVSPLRVVGAGGVGARVNGTYVACGTHNARPKYQQQDGRAIIYFNTFWKINYRDDTRGWYYQHADSAAPVPCGAWSTEGYVGGDASPAPSVCRAFEVGDVVQVLRADGFASGGVSPAPRLALELGDTHTIEAIQGDWFQASRGWCPLAAVEVHCAEGEGGGGSSGGEGEGYEEAWCCPEEAMRSRCPICLQVAKDALAHECGELFCEMCWVRCQADDDRCPVCRQDGRQVAPAYWSRRAILDLATTCQSCGEVCRLGDKAAHLARCASRLVTCETCGLELPAQRLAQHQAQCSAWCCCELCGEKVRDLEAHLNEKPGGHLSLMLKDLRELRREVSELRRFKAAV